MGQMKIAFVTSEMVPYAKTGGLADATGALCKWIHKEGHEVVAFLPRYKTIDVHDSRFVCVIDRMPVPLGKEGEVARIYRTQAPWGTDVYFVDNPEFFARDGLYGTPMGDYPDNDRRFVFFQRAVMECIKNLHQTFDVIHCHDWQTGLIPVYLKTLYAGEPVFEDVASVFTIHNLAYQGNFPPDSLPMTGLGWELFRMELLEFYGKISFLKGGIVFADYLTTVSPTYAQEIQTSTYGAGLDGVLRQRQDTLLGILNGIDDEEWNPETISGIAANYNKESLEKKVYNKFALQEENRFAVAKDVPLVGMVTRLVAQKGINWVLELLPELASQQIQFVLLGTGEEHYHRLLRDIAKRYRPYIACHIVFDPEMAKRIYAGTDLMLFPSEFEPCGLGQMIALRFGTIPIVRATGGLKDTVQEFDPQKHTGNGFVFLEPSTDGLRAALQRGIMVYRQKPLWRILQRNAMECDFSWKASAKKMIQLYQRLIQERKGKKSRKKK